MKWEFKTNALIFTTSDSHTVTFSFEGNDPLCLGTLQWFAAHVKQLERHVLECESMFAVRGIAAPETPLALRLWIEEAFVETIKGDGA